MSGALTRDGTGGSAPTEPPGSAVILLILAMLMIFSIVTWWLGNSTLAAVAGTGVVTLASEVIRRFLSPGARRRRSGTGGDPDSISAG